MRATTGVPQVRTNLRQVRAIERARMQIDDRRTELHDFGKEGVCDARGCAALGVTWKETVQVASVGQVARAAIEALDIDDRHADDRAVQLFDVEIFQHAADDFDAIQLIAVDSGCETQHRTWSVPFSTNTGTGATNPSIAVRWSTSVA